jgi:hypothetical protein
LAAAEEREEASSRRRGGLWLLALACFGIFGFSAHGYTENDDARITMVAARAWLLRGDPGLIATGDEQLLAPGQDSWRAERIIADAIKDPAPPQYGRTGENGRQYIWFPIGHQALMLPFVALGELFASWFPGPEAALSAERDNEWGDYFWVQFFCSFIPCIAAAASFMLLFLIAGALGCSTGASLLVAALTCFCTQFWPGTSETMSDMPGLACLLAAFHGLLRFHQGARSTLGLAWAACFAGAAVALRYPHALPVGLLSLWALISAYRAGRTRAFAGWILGGLPWLVFLFTANYLRFGSLTETGYGDSAGLLSRNLFVGMYLVLFSWGKGLLWFSPPFILAVFLLVKRGVRSAPLLFAALIAILPIALIGSLTYWAAGMCWGIRYLTPSVVILVAVTFAMHKPWLHYRRSCLLLCLLGLLVNLGGVLSPYRGQQQLASLAVQVEFEAAGPDVVNRVWAFSPLHSHWTYAWLSMAGRLDSGRSEDSTEPLFGVEIPARAPAPRLTYAEDSRFRHFWLLYLRDRIPGFPGLVLLFVWLLGSAWAARVALRRLLSRA